MVGWVLVGVQGLRADDAIDQPVARQTLHATIDRIIAGPACDARVRQTVWSDQQEVIGVGTWINAGRTTGQHRLQVVMHDGVTKHSFLQISDGRLAWHRTQIGSKIRLRRVDLSRLDDWGTAPQPSDVDQGSLPSRRVGGVVEMLLHLAQHHALTLQSASLAGRPVAVITGELRRESRTALGGDAPHPATVLQPTRVRVAIAGTDEPETGFGKGYPIRLEYWTDPIQSSDANGDPHASQRRLVSLVEIYAMQPIATPDPLSFRYENRDNHVDFQNDTERYLEQLGVRITDSQRLQLRR